MRYTEYVHRDDSGEIVSSVNVATVSADEDGQYVTTTGGPQQLHEGEVVVYDSNPNIVDVFNADDFGKLGYEPAEQSSSTSAAAPADAVTREEFDALAARVQVLESPAEPAQTGE